MNEKILYAFGIPVLLVYFVSQMNVSVYAQDSPRPKVEKSKTAQDSALGPKVDSTHLINKNLFMDAAKQTLVKPVADLSLLHVVNLGQYLKGEVPGLFVSEPNGEPGSNNYAFIHGIGRPILSNRDSYQSQPLLVIDGIPAIGEHPFSYDIQAYDIERIGPENNLFSAIDIDNIESIKVLKDMGSMSIYGPLAANGVIEITTRKNVNDNKRRITFNTYFGFSAKPQVTTINGKYENAFRSQFYDLYTPNGKYDDDDTYPIYLSDSLNNSYYGPSNWNDTYYHNGFNYGANASISGGGPRSNFQFAVGNQRNSGIADQTKFDKYNARFSLDLKPVEWLSFETVISAYRLDRKRNRNFRNRFAMMTYMPDLSAPLAPNKEVYDGYVDEFDKSFDNNFTNVVNGFFNLGVNFGGFRYKSSVAVDYNEGFRDLFYPSTLLEGNNYASNYFGYNQRLLFTNTASYDWKINENNNLYVEAGNILQWDANKYNYAYAYKGINDFIKLNLLESDKNNDNYLNPTAFPRQLVYKFLDRMKHNMVSFYGKGSYNYANKYTASLLLRYDASSHAQPTSRWIFTPTLSLGWNVKESNLKDNDLFESFQVHASAGRLGIVNLFDNYSQGPNYTAQIGYTGNVIVPGYNGFAALTRPYQDGWIGYDVPWAYTDQANIGFDFQLKKHNLFFSFNAYIKQNKNQLLAIPGAAEYGYNARYEAGMDVQNAGIDLAIGGDLISTKSDGFRWNTTVNFGFNSNQLKALPNGLEEVIIGNRIFKVGERIDAFWLLENQGIYTDDNQVPAVNGQVMTYKGIDLKAGDPMWNDSNNDQVINDQDKKMLGNIFPKVSGSWQHNFFYKNFDLKLNLYFNLGRHIVNQEMASRFNFINNENSSDIDAIKEITYWEKRGDYSLYPLYNPWSSVQPYQADQDLFLEKASFLKLRNISVGYNFKKLFSGKLEKTSLYVYASANNLLTLTPYSGRDPELVNYFGYDDGYSQAIPRTYSLGLKLNL